MPDISLLSWLIHLGALITLALYLAVILGLLRALKFEGLSLVAQSWLLGVHWCARTGIVFLVMLSVCAGIYGGVDELGSGRGQQFLWICCGLELVSLPFVSAHPLLRCGVALGVTILLIGSSILAHLPVAWSGSSAPIFLLVHIVPAILAQALLVLCALCGIVYLLQARMLKRRRIEALTAHFPSLHKLDRWMRQGALYGFLMMSVSIVIGGIGAVSNRTAILTWDWTQVMAILTWIVLGALLGLRSVKGWTSSANACVAVVAVPIIFLFSFFTLFYHGEMHHRSLEVQDH